MVHARRPAGRLLLHPQHALSLARPTPLGRSMPCIRDAGAKSFAGSRVPRGGNFRLIYRIENADGPSGSAYFARAGTHTELFE